jgi:hypothetical protein
MRTHAPEILGILKRRHYARSNFLINLLDGSKQNRIRDIGFLAAKGAIRRHSPNGDGVIENAYPHYFHRIYSLSSRKNKFNWHQVMVDDLMLSIEAQCKSNGLRFRDQDEITSASLELPTHISHPDTGEVYKQALEPDRLFAIENTYFVLEADRHTEMLWPKTLKDRKSWLRSMLQYRDIFKNQTYKKVWNIPNLLVMAALINETNMRNVMQIVTKLNQAPTSVLFCAFPELADSIKSPTPNLPLLGDWQRVGHPPFNVMEQVRGYSEAQRLNRTA